MALIDFTLSKARRFYLSMGNPLGLKGLILVLFQPFLFLYVGIPTYRYVNYMALSLLLIQKYHVRQTMLNDVVSLKMVKSHSSFLAPDSTPLFGTCSYHLLAWGRSFSFENSQWIITISIIIIINVNINYHPAPCVLCYMVHC